VERFLLDGVPQGVVIEFDQGGVSGSAVHDARGATRNAETAARTRALLSALKSDKFHNLLLEEVHRDQCDSGLTKALDRCPMQRRLLFAPNQKRFS
jgi:hypothetical protein